MCASSVLWARGRASEARDEQRFLAILLGLALIALGLWAFLQLSIEAYPDISDTQVIVISQFPGHAAEEIEQQVTVPIERAHVS